MTVRPTPLAAGPTPALHAEAFGLMPKAFAPPASTSASPSSDSTLSFRPGQPGAHGGTIQCFEDFRADPLFDECRHEMNDQLEKLRLLSRRLGGRHGDRTDVLLSQVQSQLERDNGSHFGSALPVVLGAGKRGLDEFCALMNEQTLDRDVLRTSLANFVDELGACGPRAGLAMTRAPGLLRLAQGGLHAELHQVIERVIEQTLLQVWRETSPLRDRPFGAAMEPHAIQQMRTELGLPGGGDEDAFATKHLVTPYMLAHARSRLAEQLEPSALAGHLATEAMGTLHSTLRREFGEDLEVVDPMRDEHHLAVQRQLDAVNVRYGGIALASVATPRDEDGDRYRITRDPSLIALDLLRRMSSLELSPPPVIRELQRWNDDTGVASLSHVDSRLFFVEHHVPGRPEPERSPVGVADLARVPAPGSAKDFQLKAIGPWRERLAAAVIASATPEELMGFPGGWVSHPDLVVALLRRLTQAQQKAWLAEATIAPSIAAHGAAAAKSIQAERADADLRAAERQIHTALTLRDAGRLSEALDRLAPHPERLAAILLNPLSGGVPARRPLEQAMASGDGAAATLLLERATALSRSGALPRGMFLKMMANAMSLEALEHPATHARWLEAMTLAVRERRLEAHDARAALTPTTTRGAEVRLWALDAGKGARLTQWTALLSGAVTQGLLDPTEAVRRLSGDMIGDGIAAPLLRAAQRNGRSEAVAALLDGYVEAARRKSVSATQLMQLLRGQDASGASFASDAAASRRSDSLRAFMSAALVALQRKALPLEDYLQLIREGARGRPLLRTLCANTPEMLGTYLDQLFIAVTSGAMPTQALKALLLARDDKRVPAIAGASPAHLARLQTLVDDLRDEGRLGPWDTRRLKSALQSAARAR